MHQSLCKFMAIVLPYEKNKKGSSVSANMINATFMNLEGEAKAYYDSFWNATDYVKTKE